MGFIDYRGTKENRYDEVVEYSRLQQEEEKKNLENKKIEKWVIDILGENKYKGLSLNDTIKYIIIRYRELVKLKEHWGEAASSNDQIYMNQLWRDFSIYTIARHLEPYCFDEEKKENYYETFANKVFKLEQYTCAEEHYSNLRENQRYQSYFSDCFEVTGQKRFWKWLRYFGKDYKKELQDFITVYEQLIVLMGYYLYQGIRPENSGWMHRLEVDKLVLDKIGKECEKKGISRPDYSKIQNPLYAIYKPRSDERKAEIEEKQQEVYEKDIDSSEDNFEERIKPQVKLKQSKLNKKEFHRSLEKQNLEDYVGACEVLRNCDLSLEVDECLVELMERFQILKNSIERYQDLYEPDMYTFYDYYVPEALQLVTVYIEYLEMEISDNILKESENEVVEALKKLLIGVNEKIDEIYRFASIQLKAKAKALDSLMSQDGYVGNEYKIK